MNFKEKFLNVIKKEKKEEEKENEIILPMLEDFIEEMKQICIDKGLTLYKIETKYGDWYSQGLPDIDSNFVSFINPKNNKYGMLTLKEVLYIKEI